MNTTTSKLSFHDIVSQATMIEAHSGYTFDPTEDRWELKGSWINFTNLDDIVTEDFKLEIKQRFEKFVSAREVSDAVIYICFIALKDCCRSASKGAGAPVFELSDEIIESWLNTVSSLEYPIRLKILVSHCRRHDRTAFPKVTEVLLKRLTSSSENADFVLTLDPMRGPWLQGEVAIQDVAIEKAYVSGVWHPEKYVLVQLLRTFGMRIESLAFMKVGDIRLKKWGDPDNKIRWPFRKNNLPTDKAMWHALPAALSSALEDYLELRLAGIPDNAWHLQSLLTVEGLPGAFSASLNRKSVAVMIKAGPYKGHPRSTTIGSRFVSAMNSLGLKTRRSGREKSMNFKPHRERHTVGMRLALKGFSAAHIAAFLGHKSENSCTAYIDLAVMCFQLREPRFFHLMDDIGSIYTNPTLSQHEIQESYDVVISKEATYSSGKLSVIGGGSCSGCAFAGASSDVEAWPCISCPKFHIYEDADLQPLWDIIQERKTALANPDGTWNSRFDPDILATLQRYEVQLLAAEMHRRMQSEQPDRLPETE